MRIRACTVTQEGRGSKLRSATVLSAPLRLALSIYQSNNNQKESLKIRHFDGTCSATPSAVRVGGLVSLQLMPISLSWIMYNGHMCHPHVPEAKRTASKSMKITITFKTSVCCLHHRPETAAATCFGSRTERGAQLAAPH